MKILNYKPRKNLITNPKEIGQKIDKEKMLNLFEAEEGAIIQYFGRIGQGKTYNATADIFDDLRRGRVVYANWHVVYEGHDERNDFWRTFVSLFGIVNRFYHFKKENLHYFEMSDEWARANTKYDTFMDWFASLTDCKIYLDEGHILFDSYQTTKFSMKKRTAILHTRHFNRTICIISQRPTAIHVSARANVNIFYKCEKLLSWPFVIFRRLEFQDMKQETVDDEAKPLSRKVYFADSRVFRAYNTKYLRGGIPISQEVHVDGYTVPYFQRIPLLVKNFRSRFFSWLKPGKKSAPRSKNKIHELKIDEPRTALF